MSERAGEQPDQHGQQGSQAGEVGQEPGRTAGEEMARKLVQDVAAYEVDPPPPARADAAPQDAATPRPSE